ncbi:MAG TPA: glycoside hydrolase family 18 protein [Verrucomicrobiae bacterium]|nr:glycoside hydrolase family 18 protein [Verrucomicrobiae bacterium]
MCFISPVIRADLWSVGYYPGWEQSSMPASNIDFAALTHVIHFSLVPNADGSLNSSANGVTTANSSDIVSRAHAAGIKVLICVGGADSESGFQGATSNANLALFINNLTNFMATRGYDGVDVDWEPLPSSDFQQYTNLLSGLYSALSTFPQHKLLTVAAGAYPPYGDSATAEYAMYAQLQGKLDQINIMTYDLSGPYDGWVTWFNSPIYNGNYHFPSSGGLVPSIDASVSNFINNGVAAAKLGIGIAFYGYVWTGGSGTSTGGVTQPRQSWTTAPTVNTYGYTTIMNSYYQSNLYHWDDSAQAAYISITNANPSQDMFVSYDDQRTCQSKISYARNRGLGGVMIWELAQDHQSGTPDALLETIKQAFTTPRFSGIAINTNDVTLNFSSLPLALYRISWTSDVASGVWNTLTNNVVGNTNPVLTITDSGILTNQTERFYRVQTPP